MVKLELRDRIEDGSLDLSMSELEEVPLKEMVPVKHKVKKLDLSNNLLTSLQPTFANQMVLLVELDLSKNKITEVPENFGLLVNLVHLDLYSNKIERLPLSFKELTKLRWLDLKDNPLTPQLAKIAGPCVDQSDCQKCAKDVVLVMQEISKSIEEKKQQKAEDRQQGAPKEKKKKKKNKGGAGSGDAATRAQLNGANQGSSVDKLEEEEEKRELGKEKLEKKTSRAATSCCSALPLRLCCAITRAFVWSLILVALFVSSLYVLSHPSSAPYVTKVSQQYQVVHAKLLDIAGDLPDKLGTAYDWLRDFSVRCVVVSQSFIVNDLPVHLETIRLFLMDSYNKAVNQVSTWMKKD